MLELMQYDLELEKTADEIRESGARLVCIQLPAGLKQMADSIQDFLEEKTGVQVVIWAGSCFGACDIPHLEGTGVELLIQWGHSAWR